MRGGGEVREARAAALLASEGLGGVRVEAVGHRQDVLVVAAPAAARERLASLAPRIRELGFRYMALDLDHLAGS